MSANLEFAAAKLTERKSEESIRSKTPSEAASLLSPTKLSESELISEDPTVGEELNLDSTTKTELTEETVEHQYLDDEQSFDFLTPEVSQPKEEVDVSQNIPIEDEVHSEVSDADSRKSGEDSVFSNTIDRETLASVSLTKFSADTFQESKEQDSINQENLPLSEIEKSDEVQSLHVEEPTPTSSRRQSEKHVKLSIGNQILALSGDDEKITAALEALKQPSDERVELLFDEDDDGKSEVGLIDTASVGTQEEKPEDHSDTMSLTSILALIAPRKSVSPTISLDFLAGIETRSFKDTESASSKRPSPEDLKSMLSLTAGSKTMSARISQDFALRRRMSSDFKFTLSSIDVSNVDKPLFDMETIPEEVDDVPDEEPEEDIQIDRKLYFELHKLFEEENNIQKIKNNYLQSRLAIYYLKRKMFYVLREPSAEIAETTDRYEKLLGDLEQLYEKSEREKQMYTHEIGYLKNKRDAKVAELDLLFERLQEGELEYGKSLTFDKTGRTNMDKVTERFLKHQKSQTELLMNLRLAHNNLKNKFTDTTTALVELDHLGAGYGILDYVQLKADNRNLCDKLEEKESELIRLRLSCRNAMQILAHNREKTTVVDLDTKEMKETLEAVELEHVDVREQLSFLKRERDHIRKETKKLKHEYGLLTNPRLLRDMETSMNEIGSVAGKIETLKHGCHEKTKHLKAVRANMELFIQIKMKEERRRQELSGMLQTVSLSSINSEDEKQNTKQIRETLGYTSSEVVRDISKFKHVTLKN